MCQTVTRLQLLLTEIKQTVLPECDRLLINRPPDYLENRLKKLLRGTPMGWILEVVVMSFPLTTALRSEKEHTIFFQRFKWHCQQCTKGLGFLTDLEIKKKLRHDFTSTACLLLSPVPSLYQLISTQGSTSECSLATLTKYMGQVQKRLLLSGQITMQLFSSVTSNFPTRQRCSLPMALLQVPQVLLVRFQIQKIYWCH